MTTMTLLVPTTGDKLKKLREDASFSQRELAGMTGISPATILKIEQNKAKKPHPSTIRKLADALNVEPRDLRGDE